MSSFSRSRIWPKQLFTWKSSPSIFSIVFALAGDSTIKRFLAILDDLCFFPLATPFSLHEVESHPSHHDVRGFETCNNKTMYVLREITHKYVF
jgi:hypothetical protein